MMRAVLMAAGIAATMLGGCRHDGGPTPSPRADGSPVMADPTTPSSDWPYWPTSMRIHPLTRFALDQDGRQMVEARIEFLDRDGRSTRCWGKIELTLNMPNPEKPDSRTTWWEADLTDLDVNLSHCDVVTRTYLFKLDLGASPPELPDRLTVWYGGADGEEMFVNYELSAP